jgi:YD repeat-containing protein
MVLAFKTAMINHFGNMMKQLFCLFFSLLYISIWAQPSIDKKIRENIAANKIKRQASLEYKYVGDKPEENGIKTSVTFYNTAGDIADITIYNPKGLIVNVEKYRYDANGNKLEYTRYSGGSQGPVAYQKISTYDTKSNLIEENGFDGVEKFSNKYTYDAQGNLSEILYRKNGVLKEKRIFKKDGPITRVSIYNPAGKLISKLALTYDSRNNLMEETVYGINQDILERKTFDYDEKKNLRSESKYRLNKMTLRTTYNYNTNGDLVEIMEENPAGGKFVKKSFSYSPKGYLIEIKWRRKANEEFNRLSYSFDLKGVCTQSDTFYPATNYHVLTKYNYEFY